MWSRFSGERPGPEGPEGYLLMKPMKDPKKDAEQKQAAGYVPYGSFPGLMDAGIPAGDLGAGGWYAYWLYR